MSNGASSHDARWYENEPERLAWEIERFEAEGHGSPSKRIGENGLLSLNTEIVFHDKPESIRVEFPAEYPAFPPRVFGPPDLLVRHQQPITLNLCLVDDADNWWRPHVAAARLMKQLEGLLAATEDGPRAVAEGEADLPEPLTGFISGRHNETVLIPETALGPDLSAQQGHFQLVEIKPGLRVLTLLEDSEHVEVAALDADLATRLGTDRPGVPRQKGQWISFNHAPAADEWHEARAAAINVAKERRRPQVPKKKRRTRVTERPVRHLVGVTFLEQGPTRDEMRRAWLFYETEQKPSEEMPSIVDRAIGTQALSKRVRRQRTPELGGLESCRFVLVGAGTLGSAIALELAKADAGQIEIVDADSYDLNNSVRHVLGHLSAGCDKASELADFAASLNPFSNIHGHVFSVGAGEEERNRLGELVKEAAVVVDATGSHAVTRALHSHTAPLGIPLVSTALTPGGYGGRAIVLSGRSPCFDCFLSAQEAGDLPRPESGPVSRATPYACSHPAASCAGFDAFEIACHATRLAVQVAGVTDYPDQDADWIVVNLRNPSERWKQGSLAPHRDCAWCGEK